MKKYLNPEPGGGVPFTNEIAFALQNEPFSAIQALYGTVASTWFVTGCTTTYVSGSTTCSLSAGYAFIGGELRELDAVTSPFPFYVIAAPDTYDQKQFGNGAVQNVFVNKRAAITTVQPLGGNYLIVNPTLAGGDDTVTKRLRPLLNQDVLVQLALEIQARKDADSLLTQSIVNEAQTRAQADITLQNNINNLAAQVAQKQNRVTTKLPWQDVLTTIAGNAANSFYTTSDNANDPNRIGEGGAPYQKFQMMRTEDGIVHVRGYVKGNGGGTVVSSNGIPPELRPPASVHFTMSYITGGNNVYPGNVVTDHTLEFDQFGAIYHSQRMSQVINFNQDPGANQLMGFHPWFVVSGSYSVE